MVWGRDYSCNQFPIPAPPISRVPFPDQMIILKMATFCFVSLLLLPTAMLSATADSLYSVTDNNGYGARYDGIGGLSGGGVRAKDFLKNTRPSRRCVWPYFLLIGYFSSPADVSTAAPRPDIGPPFQSNFTLWKRKSQSQMWCGLGLRLSFSCAINSNNNHNALQSYVRSNVHI